MRQHNPQVMPHPIRPNHQEFPTSGYPQETYRPYPGGQQFPPPSNTQTFPSAVSAQQFPTTTTTQQFVSPATATQFAPPPDVHGFNEVASAKKPGEERRQANTHQVPNTAGPYAPSYVPAAPPPATRATSPIRAPAYAQEPPLPYGPAGLGGIVRQHYQDDPYAPAYMEPDWRWQSFREFLVSEPFEGRKALQYELFDWHMEMSERLGKQEVAAEFLRILQLSKAHVRAGGGCVLDDGYGRQPSRLRQRDLFVSDASRTMTPPRGREDYRDQPAGYRDNYGGRLDHAARDYSYATGYQRSDSRPRDPYGRTDPSRDPLYSRAESRPRDSYGRSDSRPRDTYGGRADSRPRDTYGRADSRLRDSYGRSDSRPRDSYQGRADSRPRDSYGRSDSRPRDSYGRSESRPKNDNIDRYDRMDPRSRPSERDRSSPDARYDKRSDVAGVKTTSESVDHPKERVPSVMNLEEPEGRKKVPPANETSSQSAQPAIATLLREVTLTCEGVKKIHSLIRLCEGDITILTFEEYPPQSWKQDIIRLTNQFLCETRSEIPGFLKAGPASKISFATLLHNLIPNLQTLPPNHPKSPETKRFILDHLDALTGILNHTREDIVFVAATKINKVAGETQFMDFDCPVDTVFCFPLSGIVDAGDNAVVDFKHPTIKLQWDVVRTWIVTYKSPTKPSVLVSHGALKDGILIIVGLRKGRAPTHE